MNASLLPPLLLVGAGRMGGALFSGWCEHGLAPSVLVDPHPPAKLARSDDTLADGIEGLPRGFRPAAVILAVKPQMASGVLAALGQVIAPDTVFLSIMAGKTLAGIQAGLGMKAPVVRAMPNTPASIGQGISVAVAGPDVTRAQINLCDTLLASVGEVAWIDDEAMMDAVTAVSGSGPAYAFLLAELLEQAGVAQGLPAALARRLARRTLFGAGALLNAGDEDAADLRRAVTSPGGTTEAALAVLMQSAAWPTSIHAAVEAATRRAAALN